jgi:multidrug efflux pump subunit AcrA (membrane-fusion protein)
VIIIKRKLLIALAVFLGIMLFFTIVSRAVASFNVAEVKTTNAAAKNISNSVENEGMTQSHGEVPVFTLENQLLKELYVAAGDKVEKDAALFKLDTDELDKQINKLNEEIRLVGLRNDSIYGQINQIHAQNKSAADADAAARAAAAAADAAAAAEAAEKGEPAPPATVPGPAPVPTGTTDLESQLAANQIDIDRLAKERDALQALRSADGIVYAPVSGTVSDLKLRAGDMTSKTAALLLADSSSGSKLVISVPADQAKHFNENTTVTLVNNNTGEEYENIPVAGVGKNEQNPESLDVTFYLPPDTILPGTSTTALLILSSGDYDSCIPLEALHQGADNQKYVYVLEEENTALGTELTLRKVNVKVLASDRNNAAVEGLSKDQQVVVSANKNVDESSKVRVTEDAS